MNVKWPNKVDINQEIPKKIHVLELKQKLTCFYIPSENYNYKGQLPLKSREHCSHSNI